MDKVAADAGAAWEKGDMAGASANYQAMLDVAKKTGTKPEQMERLYFLLGASYFNLPDYAKAQGIFNEYVTNYPKGANLYQANLALARILKVQKKWPEAIQKYEPLKNANNQFKDDVNIELAECYVENNQKAKAVTLFETALAPGIKTSGQVRQALKLCDIYEEDNPEKGVALLERVKRSAGARPLVNEINFTALKLADRLMSEKKREEALQAFQNLRSKDEVLAILKDLAVEYDRAVERLKKQAAQLAAQKGSESESVAVSAQLDRVSLYAAQAKAQFAQLEKEKNYDGVIYYRISRCFAELNRFWEARLGFQWIYDNFPDFEDRPTVLFGLLFSNASLAPATPDKDGMKLIDKTEALAREYLKQYPSGGSVQEVAEILIAQVQKSKDPEKINKVYDEVMQYLENSPNKAQFLAVQVQNYLEQYEFVKAREAAEKFRAAVPDSPVMENIDYMYALTFFFQNDYPASIRELSAYTTKYPNGQYLADARYRLAMMMKGEEQGKRSKGKEFHMKRIIDDCHDIIKSYPGSITEADCWALIGDSYKEMGAEEMKELKLGPDDVDRLTADAFMMAASKGGKGSPVVDYGLSQARPMLLSQKRWKELESMYRDFLTANPDSTAALEAISWIGKAMVRQGTTPEEKLANEEKVKKFLAEQVLENIDNPSKEGVEDLMQQLAKSCIPKRKPRAAAGAGQPPTPPSPPPTPAEVGQEVESRMDQLLTQEEKGSEVAKARMIYVKSELYKFLERSVRPVKGPDGKYIVDNSPRQSDVLMEKLATDFPPQDLSPRLLATVAEFYLTRGADDRAAAYFNRIIQFFPQSPYMDWGLVGLGQLAYKNGDFENALKKFNQAVNDFPGAKYSEASIGKARVLFDTERYEESEKMLKEMFGDKSVPKDVLAEVNWLLGEIKQKQKLPSDAYNYFQRLYLSFKAFPKWVARGYLRAGMMKEEMGKGTDAVQVYKEAVGDPKVSAKIQNEPDFLKIKERLRALGS